MEQWRRWTRLLTLNAVSLRYAVLVGGGEKNSAAYCGSPRLVSQTEVKHLIP